MRRGTAGLIGVILIVCGLIYIGIVVDSGTALPGWPAVALVIAGFCVLAWSNTKED